MILAHAQAILQDVLHPAPYDHFFEQIVGRQPLALLGRDTAGRATILGTDPKATILDAFATHAEKLTCHTDRAVAPPPTARTVADAAAFHALIREYHGGGYTVRIPEITDIAPKLREFARALEMVVQAPADVVAFWSEAGAGAPVHYDEYHLIVIQLVGTKKWFVSADPPGLNYRKRIGEGPPPFERHRTVEVAPGDLLYLPPGTPHTVQSTTESIHIAVGFHPVTVREAIMAALDHLADLDRSLREAVARRADDLAREEAGDLVSTRVVQGIERLMTACRLDGFIHEALEHRAARVVRDLPKLPRPASPPAVTPESRLRRSPLAIGHLVATPEVLDFSEPGGSTLIHLGAETSLRFITSTPEFRVADIPGEIGDDVRIALVAPLIASGFLEVMEAG